ncbi:MAG: hypothetical protein ACE145_18660 [Terriglobia bacterium]
MRAIFLIFLCTMAVAPVPAKEKSPVTYRIPLPPRADFGPIDWLIGEWSGKTGDRSPQGEVRLSVSYDLDKRFLIFREEVSLEGKDPVPATKESWLGVLSPDPAGKGFVLRAFSNTGFITRYRVSVDLASISFNPEGGEESPPGWLFRRTLQRIDVGSLSENVQVAPPNKAFFDYYSAKLVRVLPAAAKPAAAAEKPEKTSEEKSAAPEKPSTTPDEKSSPPPADQPAGSATSNPPKQN